MAEKSSIYKKNHGLQYNLFDSLTFSMAPKIPSRIRIRKDTKLISLPDPKEIFTDPEHWLEGKMYAGMGV
jgi:hypothetical protein